MKFWRSAPDPPSPCLDKPWREINFSDNQRALQYVKGYKPHIEDQQIRIFLHGAVGAGKSSFINSVQSLLKGRMCADALADNTFNDSFTKAYTTYRIPKGSPDIFYPYVFTDIMGLSDRKGVLVDDLKLAFKGHVKDDYRFNPESKLSEGDQFYNNSPTENDKVHVLVCVVPADTLPSMSDEVKRKIRNVRLEASVLGIPQVAILTKIDIACPEVNKDLKNVYRSKLVKQRMEQFSADVGIPMSYIFPVKNYHEEIDLNGEVDSLILSALSHIIDYGEDYVNRKLQKV